MIGEIISHYKILEKLGEGGMGEIYKAEDTKLNRIVALKFLPLSFSYDKEAKKRFFHEAQAASALEHNNICTIHEIEETESGKLFISMAYYEGETLKERIAKRSLNIDQILDISIQICNGLLKAHNNNIVHRDIKPANIFITNDGAVKILDFGLAKVKGQTRLTQIGSTTGTIDYMSPEQARGEDVELTSDIWALGITMYEMLTKNLPFKADYDQALIYLILNSEPNLDCIQDLDLRMIIKKCIQKEKNNRYRSMKELLNELNIKKQKISENINESINEFKESKLRYYPILIIMIISIIIIFLYAYFNVFNSKRVSQELSSIKTIRLTSYIGQECDPTFSPDGKYIAFSWNGPRQDNFDIYVKLIDAGEPIRLTFNSLVDNKPEWSPDGRFIAYIRENKNPSNLQKRAIFIIPPLGGREQKIIDFQPGYSGHPTISWSPNSKFIFFTNYSEEDKGFATYKVSIANREVEKIIPLEKRFWGDIYPKISHDGKYIAFVRCQFPGQGKICIKNFNDDKIKYLTNENTIINGFAWGPDNRIDYIFM